MLRCIIIDDSSVIRTVAGRILGAHEGVQVLEAPTARSGYDICIDNMPDLIIVDSDLPDESGVELLEKLCKFDIAKSSTIMLLLPEVELNAVMRAKRAGAAGFLLKPFDKATLLDVLRPLLEAKGVKAAA